MTLFKSFGKVGAFITPLFLLLTSCRSTCHQWVFEKTTTPYPYFNSGRIFLSPNNPLREIGIEISRGGNGTEFYLNALAFTFPNEAKNLLVTPIEVDIEGKTFIFEAELLVGGQRAKLPFEIAERITLALLNHQTVLIKSGRFIASATSEGFAKVHAQLEKIPVSYSNIP